MNNQGHWIGRIVENTAGPAETNSEQVVMSVFSAIGGGIFTGLATRAIESACQTVVMHVSQEDVVYNPAMELSVGALGAVVAGFGLYNGVKAVALRHMSREQYDQLRDIPRG